MNEYEWKNNQKKQQNKTKEIFTSDPDEEIRRELILKWIFEIKIEISNSMLMSSILFWSIKRAKSI